MVMAMTDSIVSEGIPQYTDGYAYEVPRPFLTLQQAAAVLGKSIRTIERSLSGRWGNKLPDGWIARKLRTEHGDEWRILPPPGFRVKMTAGTADGGSTTDDTTPSERYEMTTSENFAPTPAKKRPTHSIDQPAIVIDRSEEVEHLLRELVATQKALAEERRVHLDDLRTIHQLQSSMRLLEVNHHEQDRMKQELQTAKAELESWKQKFEAEANTPWWRKLFK
jgi:hypothetical protein